MQKLPIAGIAHVGIRVHDLERSLRFYGLLGFEKTEGPVGPEPVVILLHPSGIEINLVINASAADVPNVLMDVPQKTPGITHLALRCASLDGVAETLSRHGFSPRGDVVRFPNGAEALFVRDPDGTVIELHHPRPSPR